VSALAWLCHVSPPIIHDVPAFSTPEYSIRAFSVAPYISARNRANGINLAYAESDIRQQVVDKRKNKILTANQKGKE